MTDTLTVENVLSDEQIPPSASGSWGFRPDEALTVRRYLLPSAVGVGLMASSFFANAADLPSDVVSSKNGATIESVFQPIAHRRITIAEALRLSAEIIERAENGRQKAADEEVARAFDLELD